MKAIRFVGQRLLLTLATTAVISAAPIVSVQPQNSVVLPDTTLTVSIRADMFSRLFAYQFDITFDPAILTAVGVTEGSFLSNTGPTFFIPGSVDNTRGIIRSIANTLFGPSPGATGSGRLASLVFMASAPGSTPLGIAGLNLLDRSLVPISADIQGGSVNVVPEPNSWVLLLGGIGVLGIRYKKLSEFFREHAKV